MVRRDRPVGPDLLGKSRPKMALQIHPPPNEVIGKLRAAIESALPCDSLDVRGSGGHFEIRVVSSRVQGQEHAREAAARAGRDRRPDEGRRRAGPRHRRARDARALSDPRELDPARFRTHTVTTRGFAQATVDEGRGTPLLLVHGWPETKRIWWRNVAPLAAAGFRVIAPDLRGFGESACAPDGFGDVASHSRDLAALLDARGVDRVRAGRRRPRRRGDPGLRAPLPGARRADGDLQLAAALPEGEDGGLPHAPGGGGERLLRPPGHRRGRARARARDAGAAPPLHRHLLHLALLGPPRRLHARGGRLHDRAVRRRRQAARRLRGLRVDVRRDASAASRR